MNTKKHSIVSRLPYSCLRYSIVKKIIIVTIVLFVYRNYSLLTTATRNNDSNSSNHSSSSSMAVGTVGKENRSVPNPNKNNNKHPSFEEEDKDDEEKEQQQQYYYYENPLDKLTSKQIKILQTNRPIFIVGYPKVATTSIYKMFQCSNIKSQHYCCCGSNRSHTHCNDVVENTTRKRKKDKHNGVMGSCMRINMKHNRPILDGCGNYDVYAQMDSEFSNMMYLPQHFQLEELHKYSPNATLLLNIRPVQAWVNSVMNWYGLGGRFLNTFHITSKMIGQRINGRVSILSEIYNNHTKTITNFITKYPTHPLLQIDITNPNISSILSTAFGLNKSCWTIQNKNKNSTQKLIYKKQQQQRLRHKYQQKNMLLLQQQQ